MSFLRHNLFTFSRVYQNAVIRLNMVVPISCYQFQTQKCFHIFKKKTVQNTRKEVRDKKTRISQISIYVSLTIMCLVELCYKGISFSLCLQNYNKLKNNPSSKHEVLRNLFSLILGQQRSYLKEISLQLHKCKGKKKQSLFSANNSVTSAILLQRFCLKCC